MIKTKTSFYVILLLFFALGATVLANDSPTLLLKETWRNVFAGQTALFHLAVINPSTYPDTSALWRLSYNNRTLAQGSVIIKKDGTPIELALPVPSVQEGVMVPADLTLLSVPASTQILTEKIYIFPANPFVQKKQWLTDLKIGFYDPSGFTQKAFEHVGLPFEPFPNIDTFSSFHGKLFIVGQNVDFDQNPPLWNELLALAQRNIPVLILAPKNGKLKLADNTDLASSLNPKRLVLSMEEIIHELDKNLDIRWPPDGRTSISRIKIFSEDEKIYVQIDPKEINWPWLEITLKNEGRIIICGFDFAGTLEQSPAPRYFLSRLIEYLINPYDKETMK